MREREREERERVNEREREREREREGREEGWERRDRTRALASVMNGTDNEKHTEISADHV